MKVVHLTPGSGGTFYCQNCMRDGALVKALRELGHDVVLVPMYLPLFADGRELSGDVPVFFGAVSLYLQQNWELFRKSPRWLNRVLNAPAVLRWAARKSGSTRARGLEEMTLSMLRGEHGNQAGDLASLLAWLRAEGRPDIVHLSNALLLGLARGVREALDVPVVCSLQDEDVWVDDMPAEYADQVWGIMRERSAAVKAFLPVSRYYGELMQARLEIPAERMHVTPLGLDANGYEPAEASPLPPAIGYLSRITRSLGLGVLVEAFVRLRRHPRLSDLRLRVTGGRTADDRDFVSAIRRRLAGAGVLNALDIVEAFDRANRIRFLQSVSVLSVPAPKGEAFGLYLLEAMAAGVPVVQPRCGGFTELVEATGGGLLCEPDDPVSLAAQLQSLLLDPLKARDLGRRGREAVMSRYTLERMAANVADVYRRVVEEQTP